MKKGKEKKESKSKILWIVVGIGVCFLISMIFVSSIISVGERLSKLNVYVSYGFYIVCGLFIYFLIINPLRIIFLSPSFSVKCVLEEDSKKNYLLYKKITKNIVASNILKESENKYLLDSMKSYDELKKALNVVFNSSLKREINRAILKNAKTVMISTALCPNGRLDFMTVITVNLKMIKEIVVMCGFRPNFKNLSKLSVNVFGTALIAEGLENMNLDEVLPNSFTNAIGEIPLIKPVISGVTQGITNALLTIRIGVVCRKYLFKEGEEITKDIIRRQALKESIKLLPIVVKDTLTLFPNKILKFFTFSKDKKSETA